MFKAKSIEGIIKTIATMAEDLTALAEYKAQEAEVISDEVGEMLARKRVLVGDEARANRIAEKLSKVIE